MNKKYVITSITLGVIAAVSAGLIGVTNLLTRGAIADNAKRKINSGISEIYGKSATILQEFNKKDSGLTGEYKYVENVYQIGKEDKSEIGYAFRTTGSNMYGKVSLIIGFDGDSSFLGLSIVINEQTYASTLVENYIEPLNEDKISIDDVSCGATYGAKLVRDMVNEAKNASLELGKK